MTDFLLDLVVITVGTFATAASLLCLGYACTRLVYWALDAFGLVPEDTITTPASR